MRSLLGKIPLYVFVVITSLVIGVIVSQPVAAQVTTGSISGTVTDTTGAIIPGANVTIRNVGTDLRRTIVTSATGLYMAADLEVGQYDITVQQKGFATVKKVGIDLTVGAALVENVSLTVGATTEVVQVEASAAQVETSSSQVGVLVGEKQMVDLPLNGRDYNQLIILAPGMQPVTNNLQSSLMGRATTFMVGGARPEGQAILLDGTDVQGYYMQGSGLTMLGTSLGVDGIAEFETLTNTYSAEFGGTGTAINMVTKAGTNQLHGSAYDFLRNSAFDARNYFDPVKGPPPFRRNQFGGSVGGPIKRDSRFFFVNYEGYRQALGQTVFGYVPDLNAHSGQLPCGAAPSLTCNTTTGLVTIPLASVTQQLLAFYPTTGLGKETGSGTISYTNVGSNPVNENYLIGRVDWKLSPKDDFLVRVVRDAGTFGVPFPSGVVTGDPEIDTTANYYTTLQERRSFTTNLINVLRFSFVRTQNYGNSAGTLGGILNEFSDRKADEDIAVTGITTIGTAAQVPMTEVQNKFPVNDQLYWTHGAHDVRIGGTINREQTHEWTSIGYNGQWTFQSLQAMLQNNAYSFAAAPVGKYNGRRVFHQIDFAAYFEDNWKVSQRLTLNIGLRYSPTTNPVGDAGTPLESIINPLTDTGWTPVRHAFQTNSTLTDYDPRIGLAYSPFGNAKTVIHGGFGVFHDPIEPAFFVGWFDTGPPLSSTLTQYNVTFPIPFSGTGTPAKVNTISGSAWKNPQGAHGTYIMEWNLRVERQLAAV